MNIARSTRFAQIPTRCPTSVLLPLEVAALSKSLLVAVLMIGLPAQAGTDVLRLSLEQLMDVTVIGASKYEQKQNEVAAAVSVITRDEIKAFGWRTLAEALTSLPGVHLTYDRTYSYLGTRGFGVPGDLNTRMLLTINGNRSNDAVFDAALLGRELPLDMDMIERIEYIPGPGGAVYGQNAMFGVVNIITRTGLDVDGVELSAALQTPQSLREGRFSWGKLLDNGVDMVVSLSGMRARGENLAMDFPGAGPGGTDLTGVARGMDDERDKNLFTRIARGPWSFDLAYGDRRKDDPTGSYFSDPLVPGQYSRDRNLYAQAQYQDSFLDDTLHLSGRLFLGEQRYTGLYRYGGSFLSTGSSNWHGAELRLLSTAYKNHKWMLGLEMQKNTRTRQTFEDLEDHSNDIVLPGSGYRFGVYVQDEWRIAESFSATLGLRLDRNNLTGNQLSPRAALIWQAMPDTSLKLLYGRAHRAPNAYERDYDDKVTQIANPALMGETIDTLEFVADYRADVDLNLRGSLYHWTMLDIVTLADIGGGLTQYQSGDKVKASGLELSADRTWDSGGRLRGSVSFQDVAFANGVGLDNSPHWLGKLNYSAPLPWGGLRLGYELQYDSKRRTYDGTYVDGYWLSNLNLSAGKWAKGLDVSLGVFNLFDRRYQHPASDANWQTALEQDGRSVRLKLDYHF
jgi:outer membrane receptor protein involved in Fe transport